MGERSFAEDVKQLGYGEGEILRGEGILAITKALLQAGVSYVAGDPGAPVAYLIDVLADANDPLLKPLGIYFEQSGSEAAAAALLGASINYPMRGAVTWKSVVGTNVASDALSHVASAGVIGGSVIVIGEDYGEGASILQERTHSTALKSSIPLLVLNAIHPLVPEELIEFMRGKQRVFVVEEGMPNYIERELKALAHEARLGVEIQGKELLSPHGEYVPHLVIGGLRRFLTSAGVKSQSAVAIEDRYRALTAHREKVGDVLPEPVAKRPPSFCTGCPERPVFSALKILRQREPEIGDTHGAADIGCSTFSTQAPFNVGNSVLGYGMRLASSSAVSPLFGKRTISVMGGGGFWHNRPTDGVANAE